MKRIDFEHGTITGNILGAALPMLVAQIFTLPEFRKSEQQHLELWAYVFQLL